MSHPPANNDDGDRGPVMAMDYSVMPYICYNLRDRVTTENWATRTWLPATKASCAVDNYFYLITRTNFMHRLRERELCCSWTALVVYFCGLWQRWAHPGLSMYLHTTLQYSGCYCSRWRKIVYVINGCSWGHIINENAVCRREVNLSL